MIVKGLRKIDEQEAHVDPQDLLKIRIQSKFFFFTFFFFKPFFF